MTQYVHHTRKSHSIKVLWTIGRYTYYIHSERHYSYRHPLPGTYTGSHLGRGTIFTHIHSCEGCDLKLKMYSLCFLLVNASIIFWYTYAYLGNSKPVFYTPIHSYEKECGFMVHGKNLQDETDAAEVFMPSYIFNDHQSNHIADEKSAELCTILGDLPSSGTIETVLYTSQWKIICTT